MEHQEQLAFKREDDALAESFRMPVTRLPWTSAIGGSAVRSRNGLASRTTPPAAALGPRGERPGVGENLRKPQAWASPKSR